MMFPEMKPLLARPMQPLPRPLEMLLPVMENPTPLRVGTLMKLLLGRLAKALGKLVNLSCTAHGGLSQWLCIVDVGHQGPYRFLYPWKRASRH